MLILNTTLINIVLTKEGTQKRKILPKDLGSHCQTSYWEDNLDSKHIKNMTHEDKPRHIGSYFAVIRSFYLQMKKLVMEINSSRSLTSVGSRMGQRKLEVWDRTAEISFTWVLGNGEIAL